MKAKASKHVTDNVQTNRIGWEAIWHKDGWWVGTDKGVTCYGDHELARMALTILWQRDGGGKLTYEIKKFTGADTDVGEHKLKKSVGKELVLASELYEKLSGCSYCTLPTHEGEPIGENFAIAPLLVQYVEGLKLRRKTVDERDSTAYIELTDTISELEDILTLNKPAGFQLAEDVQAAMQEAEKDTRPIEQISTCTVPDPDKAAHLNQLSAHLMETDISSPSISR